MKTCEEEELPEFLTSAENAEDWSHSRSGRFTAGERFPDICWVGDFVGPRADFYGVEKRQISFPYRESNLDSSIVEFLI